MKKVSFILFFLLVSHLSALNLSSSYELFSLGIDIDIKDEGELMGTLGFPSIYIRDYYLDRLSLSVQSCEATFNEDIIDFSFGNTSLFYNFKDSKEIMVGPYLASGVESFADLNFSLKAGFRFQIISYDYILEQFDNVAIRLINSEVGYSIIDQRFYLNISSDPLIVGMIYYGHIF